MAAPWLAPYGAERGVPRTSCTRRRCGRTSTASRRSCIRWCSPIVSNSASSPIRRARCRLPWIERDAAAPVFLLGADDFGRDVLSRLLYGARTSIGLSLVATLGAVLIGALAGAWAGYRGGWVDDAIMRVAEFVLVLPVIYVVLVLRAVLPLVLPASTVFLLVVVHLRRSSGWPFVAKGVRAIVAVEREREYVQAARSLGAGPLRILTRHLLPACARAPAGPGHAAVAGVHPRRSDAVVRRPRFSRSGRQLGHDARGRGQLQRDVAIPMDARAGGRDLHGRARHQPPRLSAASDGASLIRSGGCTSSPESTRRSRRRLRPTAASTPARSGATSRNT